MTTGAIAAVVFITLIVSLVLTVPIGFSLGIASLAYIFATDQLTLGFVARNMVTGTDSFRKQLRKLPVPSGLHPWYPYRSGTDRLQLLLRKKRWL